MKEQISNEFKKLQDRICEQLSNLDGKSSFHEDLWKRSEGGGGRTRVISNGNVFEKGGVNFSEVFGEVSPIMKKQLKLDGNNFYATGVSIVLHPINPFAPIMHMNVRYFEMDNGTYWFGGGIDMTPHYINIEAAKEFHNDLKAVCDKYSDTFYPDFKKWADDYFFIPHRDETRGVGGIFYDHQKASDNVTKEDLLQFAIDLGDTFPVLYKKQYLKIANKKFNDDHLKWRNLRRGRYVEFNLVHDRGTKFGLQTGGRIESILMSLPETASWLYNYKPTEDSEEAKTLKLLKKDIDWIAF